MSGWDRYTGYSLCKTVGTVAAISFGAELLGAVSLGVLSDAVSARTLMAGGALLPALATFLFGVTHEAGVFLEQKRSRQP